MAGRRFSHATRAWIAAFACALLFVARSAEADDSIWWAPTLEGMATQWNAPPLALNGADAPSRLVGLGVPSGSTRFVSMGAGLRLAFPPDTPDQNAQMYWQILNFHLSWSAPSGTVSEVANGEPAPLQRGRDYLFEITLPYSGGLSITRGHFKGTLGLDWGVAHLWSHATVAERSGLASGGSVQEGWNVFVHLPAAACVMPHVANGAGLFSRGESLCAVVSPTVYEWGWFRGISAGLRVEL